MKVLYVTSEAAPFAASGGLGDVMGALPAAVKKELGEGNEVSVILPLFFLVQFLVPESVFGVLLYVVPAVVGFLFISDFSLPKPGLRGIVIMMVIVAVAIATIFGFMTFKRLRNAKPEGDVAQVIEEIYEANHA